MRWHARAILVFSFLIMLWQDGYARKQGQALIDSLLKELPKKKEDSGKVTLLYNISFYYWSINPDEGIKYGLEDLALSTKLGWKNGIANANSVLGINYKYKSDYPKALEYFSKCEKIFEELGIKNNVAAALGNAASVYESMGNYPKALDNYFKALKMVGESGNKNMTATINGNIGNVYYFQSDYAKALEYYFKALKMFEGLGDKYSMVIFTGNIGLVYHAQNDYANALEFYFKDLKIAKEQDNKNEVARVTENIGTVYADKEDYANSLNYYFQALAMDQEIGNKQGEGSVTGHIGVVYGSEKNYQMAITYCLNALKIDEEIGDKYQAAWTLYETGNAYLSLIEDTTTLLNKATEVSGAGPGKYLPDGSIPRNKTERINNAIGYLQRGLDTAKKIVTPDVMRDCYKGLAEAYKLKGDYKRAFENYQDYNALKDSIYNKENERKIVTQQMKYEYGLREDSIKMESVKREKSIALRLQRQRVYTWVGMGGGLLLLVFSFFIVRERRKSEVERKKSDDLLLNILPEEVAEELKQNGNTIAKQYDDVTVLFTDFVNFTGAGEMMSPQALVDELHACFRSFDEITDKYNIEKIKTIGDAYLAVGGLPLPDAKHAENVVRAAIKISNYMNDRQAKLGKKTFEVRIGVHSGSVVAGIVGVKKFAYDIWGDTVNTAARLQQSSEPGKINISETTYELVKDKFECTYRGEIDAKNKGSLKMYYANSAG